MTIRTVRLAEAKAQLSALLDAVEAGDEVVITRRGQSVALPCGAAQTCRQCGGAGARVAGRGLSPAVRPAVNAAPFYVDSCVVLSLFLGDSGYGAAEQWLFNQGEQKLQGPPMRCVFPAS